MTSSAEVEGPDQPDWGHTGVTVGSRTPWGPAQLVRGIAPGITRAFAPGHGGYKLSPERNRVIPAALRRRSGWYEEEDEAHIVAWYHEDCVDDFRTVLNSDDPVAELRQIAGSAGSGLLARRVGAGHRSGGAAG